jgi:hypothetical protein
MIARVLSVAVLLLLAAPSVGTAQSAQNPEDVATLDGIIKAYYEVVSGPAGEKADRARDEFLHHPSALVAITSVDGDGEPSIVAMSIGEYHDRFGGPRSEGFYEFELHRDVQRFGNITHVWSTYAASLTPGGEPFTRGINSIQLYNDGERWWITSWIYDSERAGNAIPAQYLPE